MRIKMLQLNFETGNKYSSRLLGRPGQRIPSLYHGILLQRLMNLQDKEVSKAKGIIDHVSRTFRDSP